MDGLQPGHHRIDALVVIIGMMKAGTTSVFRYLEQHPKIAPCSVKEPGFFHDDREFARGLDRYFGLWDWNPAAHAWALEASTEYTHPAWATRVADRLRALDARVRLICVVRDPVDRIESQYNHGYSAGWLARNVAIDELIEKRPLFIERSRYASLLDPYRERFGAERLLILNSTDLAVDAARQMQRAVEFLQIDSHPFAALDQVHNRGEGRIVESELITRIRSHPRLFDRLQRVVPPGVQGVVRRTLGRRLTEPFRMKPETRRRIYEILADDMDRLRSEYGVDTSKWMAEVHEST